MIEEMITTLGKNKERNSSILPYLTHNERGSSEKGYFDLRPYKMEHRKDQIIRNCVDPNVGEYVLRCALGNCR